MSRNILRSTLLCTALLASATVAAKVEVQAVQHKSAGPILAVNISEAIAPGDYEVLLKGLLANPGKFKKKLALLDNIGGSVAEAIRMGRLLRESGFDTLVPADAVCQGSCVYLLAAGRDKTVRGHVGIHRPTSPAATPHKAATPCATAPPPTSRKCASPPACSPTCKPSTHTTSRVLTPKELAGYRLD